MCRGVLFGGFILSVRAGIDFQPHNEEKVHEWMVEYGCKSETRSREIKKEYKQLPLLTGNSQ